METMPNESDHRHEAQPRVGRAADAPVEGVMSADTESVHPLVTVGVPVYNGEEGIRRALDMVLEQDYPNIEIVISDNASTDGTGAICEEYAARDSRIRYFRNDVNRGATWNFAHLLDLAAGKYFLWAAHDDERAPTFIRKCVELLERDASAVLCQSHVSFVVEGHDGEFYRANFDAVRDKRTTVSRFRQVLADAPSTVIYGVLRLDAVRKTQGLKASISSDVAFRNELALYGDFVQVEETLFTYYQRAKWNTVDDDYRAYHAGGSRPWWYLPFVVLFFDQASRIRAADLPATVKLGLFAVLVEAEIREKAVKVLLKTTGRVCPEPYKEELGKMLYWKLLHTPNVEADMTPLYVNRIIKPMLGWWR